MPTIDDKRAAVFHPIVYVRGYAMTRGEIDDTTADPFCGFNLGSTVFRATADKTRARKYIFESPVLRLASDYGYADVFADGLDIMDDEWDDGATLSRRSIVVYRYYDPASNLLGTGETPPITKFAEDLGKLIARVRELVCRNPENGITPDTFRCYLVAHSMGGLVCRAFLQNPALSATDVRKAVDKFFTYATPHNGIDVAGVNVPAWLTLHDTDNFSRARMAKYLDLEPLFQRTKRVHWMPEEHFSSERVFCLIGTNRSDYEAAQGLSRTFVGHGSDGLVKIENAWVCGVATDGRESSPVAKAFVYRAHSGHFGIVNSEEAYQNLIRFLFGDLRVDVWIDVGTIRLPPDVQREETSGKTVEALYQFEVLASPRGKLWYLTRRVAEEDSVACLRYQEWKTETTRPVPLYVSSVFLDRAARIDKTRASLAYSLTLGVRVPDYEINRKLWLNQHFEGGYLFHDQVKIEIFPGSDDGTWEVRYDWQSENPGAPSRPLTATMLADGKREMVVPFDNARSPGITGRLRFIATRWNHWLG